MIRRILSDIQAEMLNTTCRVCGAGPGKWCTTATDRDAKEMHLDRLNQVRERPEVAPVAGPEWPVIR